MCWTPILAFFFNRTDASPWVQLLLPAGLILVVMGLFMSLRKRRKRDASAPTAREQIERQRQTRGMQSDLEELMVEIERLTRRFASQLDAKTAQLEALVRDADARIAELKQLQGQASSSDSTVSFAAEAETTDPLTARVLELSKLGTSPVDIARQLNEHVGKIELILALRKG